jgi:hypothetical protein
MVFESLFILADGLTNKLFVHYIKRCAVFTRKIDSVASPNFKVTGCINVLST